MHLDKIMIIEANLKHSTVDELIKTQDCIKEMLRLANKHLEVLTDMSECGMFPLEKVGEFNPHEWITREQAKISEYSRDIELITEELGRRQ
jgi:hypothetical protein